jgi:ribosomal protein L24
MAQIVEGDRIKVVQGFLQGKVGVVQSIDEDGSLKVSFGMLSSRVNRNDVQGLGPSK